jgi:membrane protein implicated in regulation of membrane protease activity
MRMGCLMRTRDSTGSGTLEMPENANGPSALFMALFAGAMALTALGTTTVTMADAWPWEVVGFVLLALALVLIGVGLVRERRRTTSASER